MTRLRIIILGIFLVACSVVSLADEENGREWIGHIPAPGSNVGLCYRIWGNGEISIDSQSKVTKVGKNNRVIMKGRVKTGTEIHLDFVPSLKNGKIFRSYKEFDEYGDYEWNVNDVNVHDDEFVDYFIYADNKLLDKTDSKSGRAFAMSRSEKGVVVKDTYSQVKLVGVGYICENECPMHWQSGGDSENHPCGELVLELDVVDDMEESSFWGGLFGGDSSEDSEYMANKVKDTNGCYIVPALAGLGAPY